MSARRMLPWIAAGLAAALGLGGAAVGAGYDLAANCTVAPLRFTFAGKPTAPAVANGNPGGFICNGTSYVPLRFVAQGLGQQVAWDGGTDTVSVAPLPSLAATASASAATVTVTLSPQGFQLVAPGGAVMAGQGQIQVWLDGQDEQTVSVTTATFTDVAPGTHTVTADLVDSQGDPVTPAVTAAVSVTVAASTGGTTSGSAPAPSWG